MRPYPNQASCLRLLFPPQLVYLIWWLLVARLLAGCAPGLKVSPSDRWLYADLRFVEAPSTSNPSSDLVAAYTRRAGYDQQIRLDLLELDPLPSFDLYLALDTGPGGRNDLPIQDKSDIAWDTLLSLPASAPTRAFQAGPPGSTLAVHPRLIPRIVRYPWIDTLVVSLNANKLPVGPNGFSLQAFLVDPESGLVLDRLGPLRSTTRPPGRAPILLTFWNTFPAYTPAQALRRWDGAHTGPYGERHGLHLLLQAVRRSKVPVVLLDLKTPAALSALDYLGKLPQIQNLAGQGLIILPDALPGSPGYPFFPSSLPDWAWEQAALDSRRAGLDFGLRASRALYSPVLTPASRPAYPLVFTQFSPAQPALWKGSTIIPIPPAGADPRVDQNGLTLELRTELLRTAASTSQSRQDVPLVILGGSLPDHPLGDPQAAESVFNYIAAHPWIQPLSESDLQSLRPSAPPAVFPEPVEAPYSAVLSGLPEPAENQSSFRQTAWQAARALYEPLPPEPEQLAQLRALYSGLPGLLQAAGDWAADPKPVQDCSRDLDQDGYPECLLADEGTLAVTDPLGGRLTLLFAHRGSGAHQLVGPVSQLIAGLSDPLEWDLGAIEAAESPPLQGAFADQRTPWLEYRPELLPGAIRLTSPDGQVQKTFTLIPGGLRVEIDSASSLSTNIPIVIDPWQRFRSGWSNDYRLEELPDGFAWRLASGYRLVVSASVELDGAIFTDSLPQLSLAEDPNYPYPPGHYLPFPMAVLEAISQSGFSVDFSVGDE